MDAIGIRIVFERRQWPEQMKQARAGKLQMWTVGASSDEPDPEDLLALAYGPSKGEGNWSRFDLPDVQRRLPPHPANCPTAPSATPRSRRRRSCCSPTCR